MAAPKVSRLLLAAALLCFLVVAAAPRAAGAINCDEVTSKLAACFPYITGAEPLTAPCCSGVQSINAAAATTPDRQAVCGCLKSAAGSINGLQPGLAAGLPGKCGVSVLYPISTSTDCSKVR